jgi:polysaccharide biosynthesis/export protein
MSVIMKRLLPILTLAILLVASCTSQKKLAYLSNLPETSDPQLFNLNIPDYKIQPRDILYITVKAMTPEGKIEDFLSSSQNSTTAQMGVGGESSGYLYGYEVNGEGLIRVPVVGSIKVNGLTLEESKKIIQEYVDKVFRNSTVDCKLLSFKFTVIGEVKLPGTYTNYNAYLTVLEAIGRAGGVGDYGNRNRVLVIRGSERGSKTFRLNLQDKSILSSEAYFLLPNDVIIVEPQKNKIFNLNLPTFSFVLTTALTSISTTLLLINYFKK